MVDRFLGGGWKQIPPLCYGIGIGVGIGMTKMVAGTLEEII
jgi:hypothetical protein